MKSTKAKNSTRLIRKDLNFLEVDMNECRRKSNNNNNSNENSLLNGMSVAGGLLAVVLILGVPFIIYKKRRAGHSGRPDSEKRDPNPLYRDYYGGGRSSREPTMEIWNRNSNYGESVDWGEGATVQDNNHYYGIDP